MNLPTAKTWKLKLKMIVIIRIHLHKNLNQKLFLTKNILIQSKRKLNSMIKEKNIRLNKLNNCLNIFQVGIKNPAKQVINFQESMDFNVRQVGNKYFCLYIQRLIQLSKYGQLQNFPKVKAFQRIKIQNRMRIIPTNQH